MISHLLKRRIHDVAISSCSSFCELHLNSKIGNIVITIDNLFHPKPKRPLKLEKNDALVVLNPIAI